MHILEDKFVNSCIFAFMYVYIYMGVCVCVITV